MAEELSDNEKQVQFFNENIIWKQLAKSMNTPIDPFICRNLDLNGFKSFPALKNITDETIKAMENFVKGDCILDRVDASDLHLYTGKIKDRTKFCFLEGEKIIIKQIAEHVTKHHKEVNAPLENKVPLFPMFRNMKRARSSSPSQSAKKSKDGDSGGVVSVDLPNEISKIRKLVKESFVKKKYPKSLRDKVSSLAITVKTAESGEKAGVATLKGSVPCPMCNKRESVHLDNNKYWNVGNVRRHLKEHLEKGDFENMYAIEKAFGAVPTSSEETRDPDDPQPVPNIDLTSSSDTENQEKSPESKVTTSKWKQEKYGRLERSRRHLGKHTSGQQRITAYYPILDQVEAILQSNQEIISALNDRIQELSDSANRADNVDLPALLQMLMDTAKKNSSKNKHRYNYDLDLKYFSCYIFILGGPMVYEFLSKNLIGAMPSSSSTEKFLLASSKPVKEGQFRFSELHEFLSSNDLPLKVWISEDGTRIVQKFQYDVKSNQIVGPTPPLTDNGVPILNSFPAESAAMIATHFLKGEPASSAYAIMAQPLQKGSPSFCLCIFGTNNKFTSEHVFKRWGYIKENLLMLGIEVLGYSSDGDPKLLTAMNAHMFNKENVFFKLEWKDWFFASGQQDFTVMQDLIHTVNKFRARLSPAHLLPIGNYVISRTHLRIVCQRPMVEHGLTISDLDKEDKMDFNSSVKICSARVTDVMEKHVPGSDGTQAYLKVMRFIMESCLDENISASEKVYKIWYALFFLRYWKAWLLNHSTHSVSENFATYNSYMCVEIIAHALIILIVKFRNENRPEDALFELFNSQHCESFFRYARSMTTTLSTVINFSMLEFLHKVRRIDILQNITSKLREKLIFPRDKRKYLAGLLQAEKLSIAYLPEDDEIQKIVMRAKSDVMKDLKKLGVVCEILSLARVKAAVLNSRNIQVDEVLDIDSPNKYVSEFNEDDIPLDLLSAFPTEDDVPNFNNSVVDSSSTIPPNSPFVHIPNDSNKLVMMKKSTFCWSLTLEGTGLCKERMLRVRDKVHTAFKNNCLRKSIPSTEPTCKKKEVEIGDYVIFKEGKKFCVGQIMAFAYLSGASRSYTLLKAPTSPPKEKTARGLGCLCVLYNIVDQNKLKKRKVTVHKYIDLTTYIATVPSVIHSDTGLELPPSSLEFIK